MSMAMQVRRWPSVLVLALVATTLTWVTATVVEPPERASAAVSGTLTGLVFHDYNVDGARQVNPPASFTEEGVGGVTVSAYDSTGALVATTTSAANGTYTLQITSAATQDVRVEFQTPGDFQPSFVGSNAGANVQFTTVSATNVNYAVHIADEFCQANPTVMSTCFYPGGLQYNATLGALRSTTWTGRTAAETRLQKQDTGALWGVAVQRTTGLVFTSAAIRRHSALGPKGLGGLYVTTTTGAAPLTSFDLMAAPFNISLSAGTDYSNVARDITENDQYSLDLPGYAGVGTEGMGDIDISVDGNYLFVSNLYERSVMRIDLIGDATNVTLGAVTHFPVPSTLCAETERPWALKTQRDGTLLVGVACSDLRTYGGAVTQQEKEELPEDAVIAQLDPAGAGTWTTVSAFSLGYARATDHCDNTQLLTPKGNTTADDCRAGRWHPWTNDWVNINVAATISTNNILRMWPQPILTDIEVLDDGSLLVGLSDRLSMQLGKNYQPTNPTDPGVYTWVQGDMVLICNTSAGLVQEANGNCGDSYQSSGRLEYFNDSHIHVEPVMGGLAVHPSRTDSTLAVSVMDPVTINSAGLLWFNEGNGERNGTGVSFVLQDSPGLISFQKAASMGDVELLCDFAPVQIGDRLWYDTDGDGIQDAGEAPIEGVTVNLYDLNGNLVATATTSATGQYLFSSPAGELAVGNGYTIRLDNPADYATGGPLEGYLLTSTMAGNNTGIDSNGAIVNGYPELTVAALEPGANNHTYDFGFRPQPTVVPPPPTTSLPPLAPAALSVSVGDYVWVDVNGDGRQDVGEPPIPGVRLTITNPDGSRVRDVNGRLVVTTTTDANGRYSFDNLPPGDYVVKVDPPVGYQPTVAGVGSREGDSSTGTARSRVLTTNGERDDTLDFGFVPDSVSVGRFVWVDRNNNGLQDADEDPIPGVLLELRDMNGNPVVDVFGNPVGSQTTDANGEYLFANLPPGQYQVFITYPPGYGPTIEGAGGGSADSRSFVAVSRLLAAGEADMTLDFGVVVLDMRLPATGYDGAGATSLAVLMLGVGLAAWLAADRRRRRVL